MIKNASRNRPLDDIDVREEETEGAVRSEGRIEFATLMEGEYVESIVVDRVRATEIYLQRILGKALTQVADPPVSLSIPDLETATILAASRYWQREGLMSAGHEQEIASDMG